MLSQHIKGGGQVQIQQAIIHELKKDKDTHGQGSVQIRPRLQMLPLDAVLNGMGEGLQSVYASSVSGYGSLGADPTLHRFPVEMASYALKGLADTQAFIDFTKESINLIADRMEKARFATGGYALFLRYANLGDDWLMVVMLKLKPGAGVDPVTMNLQATLTFDIDKLHEAARVNLSKWRSNTQPYLSFIKKRTRGEDVSEYFREALSCLNYTNSSHHTKQVIDALTDFIDGNDSIAEVDKLREKLTARQRLYGCFVASPQEVHLDTISACVMPSDPSAFRDFVRTGVLASTYTINDAFKPDKATYNAINRIKGTMGTVTVGFDVSEVKSGRVRYDENRQSLVIKQPSAQLIKQIEEHAPTTSTTD